MAIDVGGLIAEGTVSGVTHALTGIVLKKLGRSPATKPATSKDWRFQWKVAEPNDYPTKVFDDLVSLQIDQGVIFGEGANAEYGKYRLAGFDAPQAMLMVYFPADGSQESPGVCLVLKGSDPSEMEGVWFQQHGKLRFLQGTVKITRHKSSRG